jgi:hypothetical protein
VGPVRKLEGVPLYYFASGVIGSVAKLSRSLGGSLLI